MKDQRSVEIALYRRAAALCCDFTQLPMSKSTLQRLTTTYGQVVEQVFDAEAAAMVQAPKQAEAIAISAVEATVDAETGEIDVRLTRHSYRAGLWEAPTFANHLWAENCIHYLLSGCIAILGHS